MREMIASRGSGRVMGPIVFSERRRSHHPVVGQVEQDRLVGELRDALLALRAHVNGRRDARAKQLHKDVQSRKNRAPETIAALLASAFNERAPMSDVTRICQIIGGFFIAKRRGHVRKLRDLSPIETRSEGELNLVQVLVDQGDHSAPMLAHLIEACDENIALLTEMKQAATEELYGPKEVRV